MNKDKKSNETTEETAASGPDVSIDTTNIKPVVVNEKNEPETDNSDVFLVVDKEPVFPGGQTALMKFLNANIKYPVIAQENGIQGRVVCNFVVEKDGSITDVQVFRGQDPSLDKEAIRVIQSMPNWTPGKYNGENVRVRFTLPIVFRLQGKDTKASQTPPPPPPPPAYTKNDDELKNSEEVFVVVEKAPEFPGGTSALMKFLNANISYPKEAQDKHIEGRVICNFVVEKDGSISDIKLVRGANALLDQEAIRVIESMPNWSPGKQRGQFVRVRYTLPVVFKLKQ